MQVTAVANFSARPKLSLDRLGGDARLAAAALVSWFDA